MIVIALRLCKPRTTVYFVQLSPFTYRLSPQTKTTVHDARYQVYVSDNLLLNLRSIGGYGSFHVIYQLYIVYSWRYKV